MTKYRKGVLLFNLGSPDSTETKDVRKFLREFLMDGKVLDTPWLIRFFVGQCLILPFRPKASAEAYRQIWTSEGSPLVVISHKVAEELRSCIDLPVQLAMRYQNPSIEKAVEALVADGVDDILMIIIPSAR